MTDNSSTLKGPITVYAYGQPQAPSSPWVYLTSPAGGTATFPPAAPAGHSGTPIPGFALPANGIINVPQNFSGRIYFAFNNSTLAIGSNGPSSGAAAPAPWAMDGSQSTAWDFIEITWFPSQGPDADLSQVDSYFADMTFQFVTTGGSPTPLSTPNGFPAGSNAKIVADINNLPAFTGLLQTVNGTTLSRVISPGHPLAATVPGGPTFSATYFDSWIQTFWSYYQANTSSFSQLPSGRILSGTTGGPNTPFSIKTSSGTSVGQIPYPSTAAVFNNNGPFVTPTNLNPADQSALGDMLTIGNWLAGALNRSVQNGTTSTPTLFPMCPPSSFPAGTTAQSPLYWLGQAAPGSVPNPSLKTNSYAAEMHKYALGGLAYGYAYDDQCNFSMNVQLPASYSNGGFQLKITIN